MLATDNIWSIATSAASTGPLPKTHFVTPWPDAFGGVSHSNALATLSNASALPLKKSPGLNPPNTLDIPPRSGARPLVIPPMIWFINPPINWSPIQDTKFWTFSSMEFNIPLIVSFKPPIIFWTIQGIFFSIAWSGLSNAACALAPAFFAIERFLVAANTVPNTFLYKVFNPPFTLGPISLVRLLIILAAIPPDNPLSLLVTIPIFFFDNCFAAPDNSDNLPSPTMPWISSTNPPTWSFISLITAVDSLLPRLITLPMTGWVDLNLSTSGRFSFNFLTNFSGSWHGHGWELGPDCSPTSVFKKYEPSFLILEVYPVKGAKGIL